MKDMILNELCRDYTVRRRNVEDNIEAGDLR